VPDLIYATRAWVESDSTQNASNGIITGSWQWTNSIDLPGTTGTGILVDSVFGWRDIIGSPQEPTVGAGKPSFSQIATSGVYTWSFAIGDTQYYIWHIPHDYVPGTDIHFHTHWFGPQTAGGYARWQYEFLYADGHNQSPFPTTATTVNSEEQQSTTAYQHMVTESAGVTISGLEVDGIVIAKVSRIAATLGTDVSGSVFAPVMDIHYQSHNLATPNKSPSFYA